MTCHTSEEKACYFHEVLAKHVRKRHLKRRNTIGNVWHFISFLFWALCRVLLFLQVVADSDLLFGYGLAFGG